MAESQGEEIGEKIGERLYLVDGSGYIYRAFYAVAPLSNSQGLQTNALLGFSRMIVKLLKDVSAKRIAVAFDSKEPTFRHIKYDEYKANRAECPAELVQQMPYFRELTRAYGIHVLEQPGVEADDILATIALNYKDGPVTIVSGDKDLCQLVNDNIVVWDAMRDIKYDAPAVREKFGVGPDQIVDFLAMTGDTSDNVPGIPGVGPKTAAFLLNHYGSIKSIYESIDSVETLKGLRGAVRVSELLKANHEQLELSQWLVTLVKDIEEFIATTVNDLTWNGPDPDLLREILEKLEFKSALSVTSALAPTKSSKIAEKEKISSKATQKDLFSVVETPAVPFKLREFELIVRDNLKTLIDVLESAEEFAFDLETDSLDFLGATIVGLSFAVRTSSSLVRSFYLPCQHKELNKDHLSLSEVKAGLQTFFLSSKVKIGSNIKFDISVLRSSGIRVAKPIRDTMLLSYVSNPDLRQHGLKDLARKVLNEEMVSYDAMMKDRETIFDVPLEELGSYASHDADATLRIHEKLVKKLPESQLELYLKIELPTVWVLEEIERSGIKVDASILQEMSAQFKEELTELEKKLYLLAGREINLNSPKQISGLLFEELQLPTQGIKKTTHGFSTDAGALEKLSKVHEFPAKLLEYRELFKLKTTYLDALPKLIRPSTGRIHTSFNQAVAATGRLSSSDPNLQNIPIRNERGRRIRTAFVAEKGHSLICADYSQVELRILAHLSGDEQLCQAFAEGADIHTRTAELIFADKFSIATQQEQKEYRRYAKTINFGVIYGMGAVRLADELSISRLQAGEFINQYFTTYSGVKMYFEGLEEAAKDLGYVETLFGRRRYLKDVDTSGRDLNYAVRSVLNAPLQGTAADIMKIAMINLNQRFANNDNTARIVLQVHDELIVECISEQADETKKIVVETMRDAAALRIPLEVDARIAANWR